jgi:Domain of unknown function (DUF4276)
VEGHGEVEALPALLHRIAPLTGFQGLLRVNQPIRVKSGSFLNDDDYFRKQVMLAGAKAAQEGGGVLIVLDCEDDCPANLGPHLVQKAQAVRADVSILVVLAFREFETWFIAAARSLRGLHGLPNDLEPPEHAEGIRNAKGWLTDRMNVAYDPITHQIEFARVIDVEQARSNRSFNRFCDRIVEFLNV